LNAFSPFFRLFLSLLKIPIVAGASRIDHGKERRETVRERDREQAKSWGTGRRLIREEEREGEGVHTRLVLHTSPAQSSFTPHFYILYILFDAAASFSSFPCLSRSSASPQTFFKVEQRDS